MWTEILSYIHWSPNQINMSTGCSKNYKRVKAPLHHYVTMAIHNSSACLCLYPSNSSIQQPDSQVNNSVQCAVRELELLLLIAVVTDQRLESDSRCAFLRLKTWSCRSLLAICRTELRDIHVNFSISLGLLLDPRVTVVFLTAYRFSNTLDILFRSDSPRPSATGLPRDRVRCVNLALKISNRTDCPLVRKLFTNTFYTSSLLLMNLRS